MDTISAPTDTISGICELQQLHTAVVAIWMISACGWRSKKRWTSDWRSPSERIFDVDLHNVSEN
ncbi:hypothetical protein B2G74_28515 [Burkholderia sp. A27]|nr:hypothetical protein B2G74_28515 [Burkholderia sp. A27]